VIFRRLKSLPETLKSVLTIFAQFPKLDVAGSSPVSPYACSRIGSGSGSTISAGTPKFRLRYESILNPPTRHPVRDNVHDICIYALFCRFSLLCYQ
jgi:hypothetical protein